MRRKLESEVGNSEGLGSRGRAEWWYTGPGETAASEGKGLPGACGLFVLELLGFSGTSCLFPRAIPSSIKRGLE